MKKAVSACAFALLLLTGCSAADARSAAAPPSAIPTPAGDAADPASATSAGIATGQAGAAPSAPETEEQTCTRLMGEEATGPLYRSIQTVRVSEGTFGFQPSTPEGTRALHDTVLAAAETAPEDMGQQLRELSAGTEGALQAEGRSGGAVNFDPFGWSKAASDLLARCAPYEPAGTGMPAAPELVSLEAVGARFPGYPLVVDASSLDFRPAGWLSGKLVDGRVVALAPGLYAPYEPSVPELAAYYTVSDGVSGDAAMKQTVFPGSGAAGTFASVPAGTQEP